MEITRPVNDLTKKITSEFEDIKVLKTQLADIKKQERRVRRRLKTQYNNYSFLSEIVGLSMKDKKLIEPLVKYFKHLGIIVHRAPDKDRGGIEDLRIFHKNKLIILEATSIDKDRATEAKLTQVLKHLNTRKSEHSPLNVSGLTIVNHEDEKPAHERILKQNYQASTLRILTSNNLTTTTTLTLLIAFINIKKGKMTADDLLEKLATPGVYEI